jgi:hypothetical protein
MESAMQLKWLRIARNSLLGLLFLLGVLLLSFSLLSGSESYGGGFSGALKNSPNSLPWVLFIILVFIARKRNVQGGLLIALFGIAITYFFNFSGSNFFLSTFVLCLAIILFGILLIFSGLAIKNLSENASSENS